MFQEVPYLAFKKSGVLSLDGHIIGKLGEKIEGVDYYYSPVEKKDILGLSMISVHYYEDKKNRLFSFSGSINSHFQLSNPK